MSAFLGANKGRVIMNVRLFFAAIATACAVSAPSSAALLDLSDYTIESPAFYTSAGDLTNLAAPALNFVSITSPSLGLPELTISGFGDLITGVFAPTAFTASGTALGGATGSSLEIGGDASQLQFLFDTDSDSVAEVLATVTSDTLAFGDDPFGTMFGFPTLPSTFFGPLPVTVTLQEVSLPQVPLPAPLLLFLTAFGALGLVRLGKHV